ncbi:hypothetical protein JCM10213_008170 [Rhodosporidiobolus nylandii]
MPVPSLPLELIELILSHLVSPISLAPPRFYRDLRSAALVCRSWAHPAQKLLWEQVYLSKGDKQVEKWLDIEFKPGWKVKALVLTERKAVVGISTKWTTARVLQLFARCGGISRFICTLSLEKLRQEAPDFLLRCFYGLAHVSLAHPPTLVLKKQVFPTTVKSFAFVPLEPPENVLPCIVAAMIAAQLTEGQKQGHFTLTHIEVNNLIVLRYLTDLAPSLRTLVLAPQDSPTPTALRPGPGFSQLETWEEFAKACVGLTRLIVPVLWDVKLVEAVPPSVTHLEIGTVTANTFPAFCRDFDKLSKSWAGVVELRIQDPRNDERFEEMTELWEKVEESCARRGIKVVVAAEWA